jgi:saccharopine dehydrogenase (NAD+, L-lysine-forming)
VAGDGGGGGRFLLYGANGYTGVLCAEEAQRRGLAPVLAGRREEAIAPLASRLGLEHRIFGLDDTPALERALADTGAVLLAAGPFSGTSRPVVDACLKTGAHYLDVTGEVAVFEACLARDAEARARGIVILPGVGFDVVPSDCLAASLKAALPTATHLELAFASAGTPSRGTTRTMIENIPRGGAVREDGAIRQEPAASRIREIPFRDKTRLCASIPWGDISTAYFSTRIPNIVVYTRMSRRALRMMRTMRPLLGLAALGPVHRFLDGLADRYARGSSEEERRTGVSQLWGRVRNAPGEAVEGTLTTPEGYRITALAGIECMRRIVAGLFPAPGAHTPSTAFGARFVATLEGCDLRVPSPGAIEAAAAPAIPERR